MATPVALAAVTLLLCSNVALAMKGSATIEVARMTLAPFLQFGYFEGGDMELTATYTEGANTELIYLAVCSLTDLDNLLSEQATILTVCPPDKSPRTDTDFNSLCQWSAQLNSSHTSLSFSAKAPTEDYYEMLYLNCNRDFMTEIDITYNLVNPNGENLSSGDIPFKELSTVFVGIWSGVAALWLLNWLCQLRRSTPLHRFLGLVPCMQVASNALLMTYWKEMSKTGVESLGLYLGTLLVTGTATAVLLSLLVMVSKGYNVTRPSLLRVEWRAITVMSSVFIVAYATWQLMNGSFFFLFLLILVYVMVLRFLFASIAANLRLLQFQIRFVHQSRPTDRLSDSLPLRQFVAIRRWRAGLAMFLGLYIMLHVWSMMALQRSPWVEYIMVEGCTVLFVVYTLVVFRLSSRSVYFTPNDSSAAPLLGEDGRGDADLEEGVPQAPQVVIIQNPDSTSESGKVVRSVAVGTPMYATQPTVVAVPGSGSRAESSPPSQRLAVPDDDLSDL